MLGSTKGTRLVGFNTPETFEPVCSAGLEIGRAATAGLVLLVDIAQRIKQEAVPCLCKPGTHGTEKCNLSRSRGLLRLDGIDVGKTPKPEGKTARLVCEATECPKMPKS